MKYTYEELEKLIETKEKELKYKKYLIGLQISELKKEIRYINKQLEVVKEEKYQRTRKR